MIYGYPDTIGFVLGKSNIWNRQNDERSQYVGETFAPFRQTFLDDNPETFARLRENAKADYCDQLPHLTTCGRFVLHMDEGEIVSGCTLRNHLRQGQASLRWHSPRSIRVMNALVSRRYEVLYVEVNRNLETGASDLSEFSWELFRPRLPENPAPEIAKANGMFTLIQRFEAGGEYVVAVTALTGECDAATNDVRHFGRLTTDAEGHGAFLLTIVSSGDAEDPQAEAEKPLRRAVVAGRQSILDEHQRWWREYWLRGLSSVGREVVLPVAVTHRVRLGQEGRASGSAKTSRPGTPTFTAT